MPEVRTTFVPSSSKHRLDIDATISSATRVLGAFLSNESYFAGLVGGDETQIISKFADLLI